MVLERGVFLSLRPRCNGASGLRYTSLPEWIMALASNEMLVGSIPTGSTVDADRPVPDRLS